MKMRIKLILVLPFLFLSCCTHSCCWAAGTLGPVLSPGIAFSDRESESLGTASHQVVIKKANTMQPAAHGCPELAHQSFLLKSSWPAAGCAQ